MKHGSVANTVLCVNLAMIGKSRSNLSIKSFWSFDYFGRIFNFFPGQRLYTPMYFGSAWMDMRDLGNISNYVPSQVNCHLWPLLLTWINFNPSMDK